MKQITLFALLLLASTAWGQNFTVTGVVQDAANGDPLIGVNVVLPAADGTVQGTITDFEGRFELADVPKGASLQFSYIGYQRKEAVIETGGPIIVEMLADAESLEEVVVIGYGTQRKRDLTGAVSLVGSETIEELKPIKIEQALQGTTPGVNVTQQSGSPGAGLDIRIRGVSTNGQNAPLVIIDGYQSDLNTLNPSDIETITVLKDAQAAVYGTIGANGVILVTTKSGRKNQAPQVSYNAYLGLQESSRLLPLLNATEYALLLNESYAAGGQDLPYPNASGLGTGTDWQAEVFGTAPMSSHDVTISGGSDRVTYSFSGSHLDQEGIIGGRKSAFRRNTARLNLGIDLADNLKLQVNNIYTYIDRDALNESGLGSVLFNGLNAPPTLQVRDDSGEFTLVPNTPGLGIEVINPLAQIANTFNDYDLNKLNGQVSLDYTPAKGLTLTGRVGYNTSVSRGKTFSKELSYGGKVFDVTRSRVDQNTINDNNYTLDLYATYVSAFGRNNLTFTGGTTVFKEFGRGLFASGFDVPNNDWAFADLSLALGTSPTGGRDVGSYAYDERRLSYFARAQYDYDGKYLLSAMLRRDASTKFGPENRVAYFPSFTAGWIISDEGFFNPDGNFNFLKLRVSYGVLGNDQIVNNGYIGTLSGEATYVFGGALVNGTAIGVLPNPALQWEEAKKFDVGLDVDLFDYKLNITADYFINTRDNLLISNIPVSGITGTSAPGAASPTVNAGSVQNRGLEMAFTYKKRFSDDFRMSLGYNFTTLSNEVLSVNNGTGFIEGGAFGVGQLAPSRMEVGQPIGYFYGYQTDGIFQNLSEVEAHPSQAALGAEAVPGDLRFVDINGDGVITPDDRTYLGDPIPEVTMGFNVNFSFKGFDFTAYTFASLGQEMVRNYERSLSDVNRLNYVLDRWTGEGSTNEVPRVTTAATSNNVFSDFYVEDASFVRLQNVQLGYTFNLPWRNGASTLRVYGSANNLLTLTRYQGYDPAASSGAPIGGGIDFGFYPIPKIYMFGLNLNL